MARHDGYSAQREPQARVLKAYDNAAETGSVDKPSYAPLLAADFLRWPGYHERSTGTHAHILMLRAPTHFSGEETSKYSITHVLADW